MTEVEFSRLLENFQATAKQLNEASNSINSIIEAIEAKLVAANAGIECWLPADEPLLSSNSQKYQFGFIKLDQNWRLAVKQAEGLGSIFPPTALAKAPREVR